MDDDSTAAILRGNPIGDARKITGKKDDPETDALSLLFIHGQAAVRDAAMKEQDDTYSRCSPAYFLRVLNEEGFVVLEEGARKSWIEGADPESWWFFWHPEHGILLEFSTWTTFKQMGSRETLVISSGAQFHYNLLWEEPWPVKGAFGSSSMVGVDGRNWGCMHDGDGRDGLRFRLKVLKQAGKFMRPWIHGPHWCIFFSPSDHERRREKKGNGIVDWDSEEFALARARVDSWPKEVRECVEISFCDDRYRRYPPLP